MTRKLHFQYVLRIFGYDFALADLKTRYNLCWSQAIKLASDYGGGGVV